jgi:hypothetical protein
MKGKGGLMSKASSNVSALPMRLRGTVVTGAAVFKRVRLDIFHAMS